MVESRASMRGGGFARRIASALAGAALIIAVPSAGYAVSMLGGSEPRVAANGFVPFTPASGDPRVAEIVAERSGGKTGFMRFTPGGTSDRGSRSVTVAVRVDKEVARAISVRSAIEAASGERVAAAQGLSIAPTRYHLGLARGYQSFAKPAPALSASLSDADIPDLAAFAPSAGISDRPSRFAARVQLEEGVGGEAAPQLVRRSGQPTADQTLDVAGSYRLTRNLDVTAGLRYSQERDRLAALPDIEEQDSRAIYIGTQFRF